MFTNAASQPWYKDITRYQWKTLMAGFLGWGMDAFDFIIYNYLIIAIIREWSLSTVETGMVASVTVLASAVGGVFFGMLADKIGRVKVLNITIITFSIGSLLCGFSPNIWWLMAFRIVVGFGMGGEWGAGAALVSETWPSEHRGKALAIMQSAWAVGGLLAAAVAGPIVEAFGWRWVFFLGITPAIVTYFVRRHIDESAIWTQKNQLAESSTVKNSVPIIEIFKGSLLKTTLLASLFMIVVMIGNYSFNTWLPTYLATPVAKGGAGLSITKSSLYVIPYWIGCFLGYLSFGFISDKIGRRKTFSGFFIMAAALIPVYIKAALYPAIFLIIAPLVGFFVMGFFGGFGAILSELYPTRVRVTGQGFCYNVGRGAGAVSITFVGALAVTAGIGTAMMIASGLFFVAAILIWTLPETVGKELE